jgi:LAO/AO transport system kinase
MSLVVDHPDASVALLTSGALVREPRLVLGITGAPGSGKSSLTDQLASEFRARYPDRRIGIIAVDPSSPFTGGALLGDRVRMMRHATDPLVFIRSLASRGHLGGLALGARGVVRVMGLLGCDVVLIETVGVGQSEVEVAQIADLVMVVLAPGQGDSIQMLKAGLMEAGDLFVVNKADRDGADSLMQNLLSMLQLSRIAKLDLAHPAEVCSSGPSLTVHGRTPIPSPPSSSATVPSAPSAGGASENDASLALPEPVAPEVPVFLTSATMQTGIGTLLEGIESLATRRAGFIRDRRARQAASELKQAVLESIQKRVARAIGTNGTAQARFAALRSGRQTVDQLARELLNECLTEVNHV